MIETYSKFDPSGRYISQHTGDISQLTEQELAEVYVGKVDIFTHYHNLKTGRPQKMGESPSPKHVFDYAAKKWKDFRTDEQKAADLQDKARAARKAAYPSVGDQLDQLWKAMRDGVLPKVEPWYSQIEAVKAANPIEPG